jgi:hypothetical protein
MAGLPVLPIQVYLIPCWRLSDAWRWQPADKIFLAEASLCLRAVQQVLYCISLK